MFQQHSRPGGGGGGGGGTPLYMEYRYTPPQRVWFFAPLWSENGYRLCPFWSRYRVRVSKELRECMRVFVVSIPNELNKTEL